jgi:hypothetical protein
METTQKILIYFLLPMVAVSLGLSGTLGLTVAAILSVILFGLIGLLLLQGRNQALTLTIFLQGLNVIVGIMMFFPHATYRDGTPNFTYIVTSVLGMSLSIYLLLRLDRVDVRTQMVR